MRPLPENLWKLDVQSTDGCDKKSGITVSEGNVEPLEGSRGEANYVMKWKGATQQSYIKIMPNAKGVTGENFEEYSSGVGVSLLIIASTR